MLGRTTPPEGDAQEDLEETVDLQVASQPDLQGFTVLEKIGEGGMGTVWSALEDGDQRSVAIKVIRSGGYFSENASKRFAREVKLASQLEHPNIVRVYDSGIARGAHYYVMELVEGLPLHLHVSQYGLSLPEVLRLFAKICLAMQYAHERQIIHRDLKPSNILVTADHEPHILDFGMAKMLDADAEEVTCTVTGGISGTVSYMSPEQAAGDTHAIDHRTDIYAVGINFYRCVIGDLPFNMDGPTVRVINRIAKGKFRKPGEAIQGIFPEVEKILGKALSLKKEQRFQDMEAFAKALDACAQRAPNSVKDGARRRVIAAWVKRVAIGALVLASLVSYGLVRRDQLARMSDVLPTTEVADITLHNLADGSHEARAKQAAFAAEHGLAEEVISLKSSIRFRLIPPGAYTRGSSRGDVGWEENEKLVDVILDRPLYVGCFEVSQSQWKRVMGDDIEPQFDGEDRPMESIAWVQAVEFIEKLCRLEGVPVGTYRLLSESEWEYACRAGTKGALFFLEEAGRYINYCDQLCPKSKRSSGHDGFAETAPVGSLLPNAWGLFDMLGNVSEWVSDPFSHSKTSEIVVSDDPERAPLHMMRGGAWSSPPSSCQSTDRNWLQRGGLQNWIGLRVVREVSLAAYTPGDVAGPPEEEP